MDMNGLPKRETQPVQTKQLLSLSKSCTKVNKNQYLFSEGMTADGVFIILNGKIQISKITPDGQEFTFRICSEGDIVGEAVLFSHSQKYLLNARALENTEAAFIPKDVLETEIFKDGQLAFEFMKWLSNQYQKTQLKFRDLIMHGKKGALYSTLIRASNSYGSKRDNGILIDIPLTNQELANFCGATRESVNRMLSELKKEGVVSIISGKILIRDLQYLKDAISCEDCPITFCNIE